MVEITISGTILLKKSQLPRNLHQSIKQALIFDNPKYVIAQKYGYSVFGLSPQIAYYTESANELIIPKGFIDTLQLTLNNKPYVIKDSTYTSKKTIYSFIGKLFPYQQKAVDALLQNDIGMLCAPCASGKTVVGLALLALRQQNTIILVHTKDLLKQWLDNITEFLCIPKRYIGIIGAGKYDIKPITVGTIQTITKCEMPSDYFGMVISDEAHHLPAETFINTIAKFNCKYQLGLTATPYRKDGLTQLIKYYIGEIRYTITEEDLQKAGRKIKPVIKQRMTEFSNTNTLGFVSLINEIIADEDRNNMIIADIQKEVEKKHICLVLSHRVEHCITLHKILREKRIYCQQIDGKTDSIQRREILKAIKEGKVKVLFATGNLAGEGLDLPVLNRLFLVTPNSGGGKLIQYLGRILRVTAEKKDAVVYDYIDIKVGTCWGMWLSRKNNVYSKFI